MEDKQAYHKGIGRDVLIAAIANIIRNLRNVILIPLITGSLSIAHYGEWDLVFSAIALATPWLTLGLAGAILRFLPGSSKEVIREGFWSIFFAVFSTSAATVGFLLFLSLFFSPTSPFTSLQRNIFTVASVCISTVLLIVAQTYFRAFRLMLSHSILTLSQHLCETLLIFYLIHGGHPLSSALWAMSGIRVSFLFICMGLILNDIGFAWPRFNQIRSYLNFSIPLIPNSLFYRLYDSADRFFIFTFVGSTAVGNYAVMYLAGSLFTTMVSPIHTVLLPTMAELWNKNKRSEIGPIIEQIIRLSALITLPTLAGAMILYQPLLGILMRGGMLPNADYFLLICISFVVFGFGIPLGDALNVAGKTRHLFVLNGSLAGINLLLNFMLVPTLGILGAVFSTLVCHATYTISAYYFTRTLFRIFIPWPALLRILIATILMAIVLLFFTLNDQLTIITLIVLGFLVYVTIAVKLNAITTQDIQYIRNLISRD